jgi:hypothetical protein
MKIPTPLSIVAPALVFGFLYVFVVQPQRAAWRVAEKRVESARSERDRRRETPRPEPGADKKSALDEFDIRTATGDPGVLVTDAVETVVNSPSVGGVSNLSVETGAPAAVPPDSTVNLFPGAVMQMPIAIGFDARYEQVGRFLANLRAMPTTFELRSIEVTPSGAPEGLVHARAELAAFFRPAADPEAPRVPVPQVTGFTPGLDVVRNRPGATRDREAGTAGRVPEVVVSTILFSSGRRIALVDGRIVGPGDRIRSGFVQAIEPEAVLIEGDGGGVRRVELDRPVVHMAKR